MRHGSSLDAAQARGAEYFAARLADFGEKLYADGHARHDYVAAVLFAADARRAWRMQLQEAWDVNRAWKHREPGKSRLPVPEVAFFAAIGCCCAWRWYGFVTYLLVGWCGKLRPGETMGIRRRHVCLPCDLGSRRRVVFITLGATKTSKMTNLRDVAREQHCRIDHVEVVAWLEAFCADLPDSAFLFNGSESRRDAQWKAVFGEKLGFSTRHLVGLTPASLRPGGATTQYEDAPGSLEQLRFEMRHTSIRSTEKYIQECAAARALLRLPASSRQLIAHLADAAGPLLTAALDDLRGRVAS